MVDIIDFALHIKYPGIFGKLEYKKEPSTTSLLKAEFELKRSLGEELPLNFDLMQEYMEKYCGKNEAISELKNRVEEMANRHWSNLLSKVELHPDEFFPSHL